MNILLILLSVLLSVCVQLLMRKGMLVVGNVGASNILQSLVPMLTNLYLWSALFCSGVGYFLWMIVLSRVEASYAAPFVGLSYVGIAVAGYFLFNENISLLRIIGILVVCTGVYLISRS